MATKNFDTIINQINEGLFDRAKANVAGMVGSAKGIGTRISGAAQAVPAALMGNKGKLADIGQKSAAAKQMGIDAKTQSIVGSHQQKLTKAINDYANDLSKMKLSDQKSIDQLKQDLTSQIQSAVKVPTAPATATGTPSAGTATGAAGSTSTSSGAPAGSTTTSSSASTAPTTSAATAPTAPGAASPTTGTPAAATPPTPAATTPSPTTPTSLTNPDSIKAAEAKLKDLANQEKILKAEMSKYQGSTQKAQFAAQLKGLEAQKQAAIKEKQAAQAAIKTASMSPAAQKQQAKVNALKAQPKSGLSSVAPTLPRINASHIPTGLLFSELYNSLEAGLKPSSKYNLLS